MIGSRELSKMYKLKNLIRYNNRTKIKDEDVAEHSFFVALISLMLCDDYAVDKSTMSEAIVKALLHDMPETELNDITHDVKERLNLNKFLEEYETDYYNRNFSSFASIMSLSDGSLSSCIVNLADALSVKQYVENEIALGNTSQDIIDVQSECEARISDLETQFFEALVKNEGAM